MKLLSAVWRKVFWIFVLTVFCIATEQAIHCVMTPGYLFHLLVSPTFWGGFSLVCFAGVWWMDKQYPQPKEQNYDSIGNESEVCDCGYHPIWDNPLNIMNPVYIFRHTGE